VVGADPLVRPDEADALLDRVGIAPDQPLASMSGGQHRRVALARTLVAPADLLVLDEPTNHLDVDTIDWLEEELRRRACGLVLVTHDRYVLERLTNRMLDLVPTAPDEPAEVWWHDGSYSSLLAARAERAAARQRATARARNLLRKEIAWLQRGPKARTSKPRFRREQVEVLRSAAAGDPEARPLDLGTGRRRLGDDVFELEEVTVVRGEHTVLDRVDLGIGPGERSGWSDRTGRARPPCCTCSPAGWHRRAARSVSAGPSSSASTNRPPVPGSTRRRRCSTRCVAVAPHVPLASGETLPAHRLAERFGFDGTVQRTPIGLLSGGERRRVALLHLLVAAPNVLLLDEPTNDLDLDTLATLEDHLDGFAGTLVVASHDRYVLDRLTDRTLEVDGGRIVPTSTSTPTAPRSTRAGPRPWRGPPAAVAVTPTAATARATVAAGTGSAVAGTAKQARDNRSRQAARRQVRSLEQRLEKLTGHGATSCTPGWSRPRPTRAGCWRCRPSSRGWNADRRGRGSLAGGRPRRRAGALTAGPVGPRGGSPRRGSPRRHATVRASWRPALRAAREERRRDEMQGSRWEATRSRAGRASRSCSTGQPDAATSC
jgi:ABC transport system ATP-binding/permease protein